MHDVNERHGDICRTLDADNGSWECPVGCEITSDSMAPYCRLEGTLNECHDPAAYARNNVFIFFNTTSGYIVTNKRAPPPKMKMFG